jgi:hypothetical protein
VKPGIPVVGGRNDGPILSGGCGKKDGPILPGGKEPMLGGGPAPGRKEPGGSIGGKEPDIGIVEKVPDGGIGGRPSGMLSKGVGPPDIGGKGDAPKGMLSKGFVGGGPRKLPGGPNPTGGGPANEEDIGGKNCPEFGGGIGGVELPIKDSENGGRMPLPKGCIDG